MANETRGEEKNERDEEAIAPVEERSETEHAITVDGEEIAYRSVTGTLLLKDEKGKATASIFYVAYLRKDITDPATRPLTFSFNGGPGSSSVWMHMGLLGPRRALSGDVDDPQPPPYRLVDNEYTLLTHSDLVFIDPVSTGFSRPAPETEAKAFHGYEQDIESVGDFIRLFTTRHERWFSPKFLIGESYGTTRAAGLSGHLQDRHGLFLNGIMLVSSILTFQTARFTTGNDLPYLLFLPTYTATAWYHCKLDADLQADRDATLREVEHFALTEYNLALAQGASLPDDQRAAIVEKLARYTGLSQGFIQRANLRVDIHRFVKELLREENRTVGRFDSRFKGIDRDAAGEHFEHDPSYAQVSGAYSGVFNGYVRRELGFESDQPYEIIAELYKTWDYSKHQNQFLDAAETLRAAMTKNQFLKVFVANGLYDLATPYFATRYTFDHLGIDPSLQANIGMGYYDAGHMMYVHEPSLAQLKADLAAFVEDAK